MHGTTRDILGEAAYVRRAAEILIQHVHEVEQAVSSVDELNRWQAAAMAGGPVRMVETVKQYIESATQYVDAWRRSVEAALGTQDQY